jgi:hypothetical protein
MSDDAFVAGAPGRAWIEHLSRPPVSDPQEIGERLGRFTEFDWVGFLTALACCGSDGYAVIQEVFQGDRASAPVPTVAECIATVGSETRRLYQQAMDVLLGDWCFSDIRSAEELSAIRDLFSLAGQLRAGPSRRTLTQIIRSRDLPEEVRQLAALTLADYPEHPGVFWRTIDYRQDAFLLPACLASYSTGPFPSEVFRLLRRHVESVERMEDLIPAIETALRRCESRVSVPELAREIHLQPPRARAIIDRVLDQKRFLSLRTQLKAVAARSTDLASLGTDTEGVTVRRRYVAARSTELASLGGASEKLPSHDAARMSCRPSVGPLKRLQKKQYVAYVKIEPLSGRKKVMVPVRHRRRARPKAAGGSGLGK